MDEVMVAAAAAVPDAARDKGQDARAVLLPGQMVNASAPPVDTANHILLDSLAQKRTAPSVGRA